MPVGPGRFSTNAAGKIKSVYMNDNDIGWVEKCITDPKAC